MAIVAVLRGELFGFSDADLFAIRQADGRFNYRAAAPKLGDSELAERYRDACDRLHQYATWLKRLPAAAAVERIVTDLGLIPRALTASGGNLRAGTLLKALQVLRASNALSYSLQDLLVRFEELLEGNLECDALPAQPHREPVVRLMNLHKAKGLEASVVFLADPTGKYQHPIRLHIDRAGDATRGYLAIRTEDRSNRLLACPADWEHWEQQEQKFGDAEQTRLMYVAGTRAGSSVVITQRVKGNNQNRWGFFGPHVATHPRLPEPPTPPKRSVSTVRVSAQQVQKASAAVVEQRLTTNQPSYAVLAAKSAGVGQSPLPGREAGGEHGTEWGTVIHYLLEMAAQDNGVELHSLAEMTLREEGLSAELADTAVAVVSVVRQSEIWRRAAASPKRFVEAPFMTLLATGSGDPAVPTVIRGVIDLVFWEADGWVIVDYKTDDASAKRLPALVDHYRGQLEMYSACWRQITSQPVREAGLLFVSTGKHVTIELPHTSV